MPLLCRSNTHDSPVVMIHSRCNADDSPVVIVTSRRNMYDSPVVIIHSWGSGLFQLLCETLQEGAPLGGGAQPWYKVSLHACLNVTDAQLHRKEQHVGVGPDPGIMFACMHVNMLQMHKCTGRSTMWGGGPNPGIMYACMHVNMLQMHNCTALYIVQHIIVRRAQTAWWHERTLLVSDDQKQALDVLECQQHLVDAQCAAGS